MNRAQNLSFKLALFDVHAQKCDVWPVDFCYYNKNIFCSLGKEINWNIEFDRYDESLLLE